MKNRDISSSEEIYYLVVIRKFLNYTEDEIGLPKFSFVVARSCIKNVVVVDDSLCIFSLMLVFVGSSTNEVLVFPHFPNPSDIYLQVIDSVLVSQSVEGFDDLQFSLRSVSQIKVIEADLLFVLIGKPNDFGVIVTLEDDMVIRPLVVFGHVYSYRLAVFMQIIISVVGEPEPMVVERALLLHAEGARVREVVNVGVGSVIEQVLMVD